MLLKLTVPLVAAGYLPAPGGPVLPDVGRGAPPDPDEIVVPLLIAAAVAAFFIAVEHAVGG